MNVLTSKNRQFKNRFLHILMLVLSMFLCAKSVSLNIGGFSLGKVEVQASPVAQSAGKTVISGTAIVENNTIQPELVQNIAVQIVKPEVPKPSFSKLSDLIIPAINLETPVDFATVKNLPVLDQKLLYNPLIESVLSSDFCTLNSATYVYGHSEPSVSGTSNYPATYIFKNLDLLKVGDKIDASNLAGTSCSYKISEIFVVTTNNLDQVTDADYAKLFYPALVEDKSILTLQTCVKGSATKRLIIRAISV